MNNCIKLTYPINSSRINRCHLRGLEINNLLDLNFRIRSNSKKFLNFVNRIFHLFIIKEVRAYYRKEFKTKNICIEAIFAKEEPQYLLKGLFDLERNIKYLFWERFIILHSSCVQNGKFNLIFMGGTKSGKSTIASAMLEKGARVLSDDYCFLGKSNQKAYLFPTLIGAIRKGEKSHIYKKYLFWLDKYTDSSLTEKIISLKESEFKALIDYHKQLYGINEDLALLNGHKNINIFILLENGNLTKSKDILIPRKPLDLLPRLMENVAANSQYYKYTMKESLDLFLSSQCYILKRAPLQNMVDVVSTAFRSN